MVVVSFSAFAGSMLILFHKGLIFQLALISGEADYLCYKTQQETLKQLLISIPYMNCQ